MRLLFVPASAALLVSGCGDGGADPKVACAGDVGCPAGWECVDAHCVPPDGTGGGSGSGPCVPRGDEKCNGIDDDCDGATDASSCPWHFGTPMPVVELHTGLGDHLHPHTSRDGLRLYYGGFDAGGAATTVVATRESRRGRFLAPDGEGEEPFRTPAVVHGLAPLGAPGAATFSSDELEAFIQVREPTHHHHFDIAFRGRADAEGVFEDRGLVPGASRGGVDEIQPSSSRDGRELFFSANAAPSNHYRLYRIARDESGAFSGEATELTLLGDAPAHGDFSPTLVDDGETLLYESIRRQGEGAVLMRAVRDRDGDPNVFTIAGPLPARVNVVLSGEPSFSESTGELFFVSTQPWSPASIALWRMRVCRDAPCPEEEPAPCPARSESATRSPDGRRCYAVVGRATGFDAARVTCESAGGTLASIHSAAEASLLGAMLGAGASAWIGARDVGGDAFAWTSGEPFLYAPWGTEGPAPGSGCVALASDVDAVFEESDCSHARRAICEVATYPTW